MERKTLAVLFFLLFFFAADVGVVKKAEGRLCQAQSHSFRGYCMSDTNCAHVCSTEGFTGGKCRGFRHRCFCTRFC